MRDGFEQSANDSRRYRAIRLKNDLTALLISDKDAENSVRFGRSAWDISASGRVTWFGTFEHMLLETRSIQMKTVMRNTFNLMEKE